MIIKASQRGGANRLAAHLLNANDNEHVTMHDVSGFVSDNLSGALHEAYAISRGTRCRQFLFSVSLSPPPDEIVPVAVFEDAAHRIEESMGLVGQPSVIVFHEKNGRRHAHAVWSRINPATMTAINLPFFKNKLMALARELYLEHGWALPPGLIDRQNRNPLNFTLAEWQKAKRLCDDPRASKLALQECWAITKDKDGFKTALERKGYYLAKGDRRGYVAVDWRGEVYSLSRQLNVKAAALKARLGDHEALPSVEDTKARIDQSLADKMKAHLATLQTAHERKARSLIQQKATLLERHRAERERLKEDQDIRWKEEQQRRAARFRAGLKGLLDRVTGKHHRIRKDNELEALMALRRDREERDNLALSQIRERAFLQRGLKASNQAYEQDKAVLREAVFSNVREESSRLDMVFSRAGVSQAPEHTQDSGPHL